MINDGKTKANYYLQQANINKTLFQGYYCSSLKKHSRYIIIDCPKLLAWRIRRRKRENSGRCIVISLGN